MNLLLCVFTAVLLLGCSSTPTEMAAASASSLINSRDPFGWGEKVYLSALEPLKESGNQAFSEQVARVMNKLRLAQPTALAWEVKVVAHEEVFGFSPILGKLLVSEGLVQACRSDAELAILMTHLMSHSYLDHLSSRLQKTVTQSLSLDDFQAVMSKEENDQDKRLIYSAFGAGLPLGFALPFDQSQETEADRMSLSWAARGGFDPKVALGLWERLQHEVTPFPDFVKIHPLLNRRKFTFETEIALAEVLYQEARRKENKRGLSSTN